MKFVIIYLLFSQIIFGQNFGQNKVQYNTFDWEYIVSPNFNVYYYGDNYDLAVFTSKGRRRVSRSNRQTLEMEK
jgi:hypothetical protein